jgi:putative nucleotidyltransferase with HDIG domain
MQEGNLRKDKYTILAVDDEIHSLSFFKRTFRKDYNLLTASEPLEAVEIIKQYKDELAAVLCDQAMPKMSGTEVLKIAKVYAPTSVRIMVTAFVDTNAIMDCINECEAYGYIVKPFEPGELKQTLNHALISRERALENKNIVNNLRELLFSTIGAICEALEEKDQYTIGHSRRVTRYAIMIGQELGLSEQQLQKLNLAGLLHDIGKIGTPEYILNKPGRLTDEEFDKIREHPRSGADIIKNLKQLGEVIDWVRCHHERFDGRGYPDKLVGDKIPLGAAILSVADTYDAMTSDRSYRKGLPHEVAVQEIKKCTGSQFHPEIAAAFLRIEDKVELILKHKDNGKEDSLAKLLMESEDLAKKICIQ